MPETTIVAEEAQRFGKLAADWWDPKGSSSLLHKLNPVRLKYVRDQIDQHWQGDECSRAPLAGKRVLDVGCGGGLLTEPLRRLGAEVTGIDASPEVIAVAREHARAMGLEIDYRSGDVQELESQFDLITAMEVVEHVAEPAAFLGALARRLAPGGLLLMSTPNATAWSRLLLITVAEGLGHIPRHTHDFDKFIAPDRMKMLLADAGLKCVDIEGIAWSPTRGVHLSDDLRLNYLLSAVRG
ncbi:MAG TPA: bifunctional 2-polyprenyl-6-hydroxyphenol methylase/3-demethylubiquinol 3-O-methyltransferase UbiG [Sphingomicrobium sp.]|jgi:2-polyprenyl-6-hydroxyphenyl methylase/3-demethylubiquinone-9 3-methyltransferase|nr:bifunctional 2-polyprenyl-6-hydroxyphenol methylase/3-demethylubiquinol 3-O-methyltransferase UbiG [Sphingomicrobium sp.]